MNSCLHILSHACKQAQFRINTQVCKHTSIIFQMVCHLVSDIQHCTFSKEYSLIYETASIVILIKQNAAVISLNLTEILSPEQNLKFCTYLQIFIIKVILKIINFYCEKISGNNTQEFEITSAKGFLSGLL